MRLMPLCNCPIGYYGIPSGNCLPCTDTCSECDYNLGCTLCKTNMVNSYANSHPCACPAGSLSHATTQWCTTCSTAVLDATLSPDSSSIVVNLFWALTLVTPVSAPGFSQELCDLLLSPPLLPKLGPLYTCR